MWCCLRGDEKHRPSAIRDGSELTQHFNAGLSASACHELRVTHAPKASNDRFEALFNALTEVHGGSWFQRVGVSASVIAGHVSAPLVSIWVLTGDASHFVAVASGGPLATVAPVGTGVVAGCPCSSQESDQHREVSSLSSLQLLQRSQEPLYLSGCGRYKSRLPHDLAALQSLSSELAHFVLLPLLQGGTLVGALTLAVSSGAAATTCAHSGLPPAAAAKHAGRHAKALASGTGSTACACCSQLERCKAQYTQLARLLTFAFFVGDEDQRIVVSNACAMVPALLEACDLQACTDVLLSTCQRVVARCLKVKVRCLAAIVHGSNATAALVPLTAQAAQAHPAAALAVVGNTCSAANRSSSACGPGMRTMTSPGSHTTASSMVAANMFNSTASNQARPSLAAAPSVYSMVRSSVGADGGTHESYSGQPQHVPGTGTGCTSYAQVPSSAGLRALMSARTSSEATRPAAVPPVMSLRACPMSLAHTVLATLLVQAETHAPASAAAASSAGAAGVMLITPAAAAAGANGPAPAFSKGCIIPDCAHILHQEDQPGRDITAATRLVGHGIGSLVMVLDCAALPAPPPPAPGTGAIATIASQLPLSSAGGGPDQSIGGSHRSAACVPLALYVCCRETLPKRLLHSIHDDVAAVMRLALPTLHAKVSGACPPHALAPPTPAMQQPSTSQRPTTPSPAVAVGAGRTSPPFPPSPLHVLSSTGVHTAPERLWSVSESAHSHPGMSALGCQCLADWRHLHHCVLPPALLALAHSGQGPPLAWMMGSMSNTGMLAATSVSQQGGPISGMLDLRRGKSGGKFADAWMSTGGSVAESDMFCGMGSLPSCSFLADGTTDMLNMGVVGGSPGHDASAMGLSPLPQMDIMINSLSTHIASMNADHKLMAGTCNKDDVYAVQLLERVGHGGQGFVFRGLLHGLEVAVKVVPQDQRGADVDIERGVMLSELDARRRKRRLLRDALELAVTMALHHPNIVQLFTYLTEVVVVEYDNMPGVYKLARPDDVDQGLGGQAATAAEAAGFKATQQQTGGSAAMTNVAICLEYCDTGCLKQAIKSGVFRRRLPTGREVPHMHSICLTLLEMALALRYLHGLNLVHCDLKPQNILLKSSSRDPRTFTSKLGDFGCVRLADEHLPSGRKGFTPTVFMGTVTHMSPETFVKGASLDAGVDIYAFGILMWELLTGGTVYEGLKAEQVPGLTHRGTRPVFPVDTPMTYRAIAVSCWAHEPLQRPTSATLVNMLQRLVRIYQHISVHTWAALRLESDRAAAILDALEAAAAAAAAEAAAPSQAQAGPRAPSASKLETERRKRVFDEGQEKQAQEDEAGKQARLEANPERLHPMATRSMGETLRGEGAYVAKPGNIIRTNPGGSVKGRKLLPNELPNAVMHKASPAGLKSAAAMNAAKSNKPKPTGWNRFVGSVTLVATRSDCTEEEAQAFADFNYVLKVPEALSARWIRLCVEEGAPIFGCLSLKQLFLERRTFSINEDWLEQLDGVVTQHRECWIINMPIFLPWQDGTLPAMAIKPQSPTSTCPHPCTVGVSMHGAITHGRKHVSGNAGVDYAPYGGQPVDDEPLDMPS